jgi:hypothetical protein
LTAETTTNSSPLRGAKISVPQHVVYRSFPSETVVLNLNTGKYHGLNGTAGQMLDALEHSATLRQAAGVISEACKQPRAAVERDMCQLCEALLERGLIEIDGG